MMLLSATHCPNPRSSVILAWNLRHVGSLIPCIGPYHFMLYSNQIDLLATWMQILILSQHLIQME